MHHVASNLTPVVWLALVCQAHASQGESLEREIGILSDRLLANYAANAGNAAFQTTAVFPFEAASGSLLAGTAEAVPEYFVKALHDSPRLILLERRRLKAVLEEQKFQLTGAVGPEHAVEIGKLIGARLVLTGTLSEVGDTVKIVARLVRVETAEVAAVAEGSLPRRLFEDPNRGLTGLFAKLRSGDLESRWAAAEELWRYGDAAVPGLGEALGSGDEDARWLAAFALYRLANSAEAATRHLVDALEDPSQRVRYRARRAIERLPARARIEAHAALIQDPKRATPRVAVTLAMVDPESKALRPSLLASLKGTDREMKIEALKIIRRYCPREEECIRAVIGALGTDEEHVRREMASTLGHSSDVGLPHLTTALKDRSASVRADAARAMGMLIFLSDADQERAASALLKARFDPDASVRDRIAEALAVRTSGVVIEALDDDLSSRKATRRRTAASALSLMAAAGYSIKREAGIGPALAKGLVDDDVAVRRLSARGLANCAMDCIAALDRLIEATGDPDWEVRSWSVLALGGIGPDGEGKVVSALRRALHDDSTYIRKNAASMLGQSNFVGAEP